MRSNILLFVSALAISAATHAQNSAPQPVPFTDTIPVAVDKPYPGTVSLKIDTSDTDRAIYRMEETIPLTSSGPMTLLFPSGFPAGIARMERLKSSRD